MWMIYRIAVALPVAAIIGIPVVQHVKSEAANDALAERDLADAGQELDQYEVFANGVIEGRHREVPLHFENLGRLMSVGVEEGETVTKGQLLAQLDASEWTIELNKALADLERARAERELLVAGAREEARKTARAQARVAYEEMASAKIHLERTETLTRKKVLTDQELDDRKAAFATSRASYKAALARVEEVDAAARSEELRIADAKIDLAKSRVDHARNMLQKTQLEAPFDGVVLQRWGEPGQLVGPASERPIVVMADASEKRVRAFVEELDAMQVAPGSRAYVQADGMPDVRIPGRVIRCAPGMVPKVNFSNRPSERVDVRVREVVIQLEDGPLADAVVLGLPVDVFVERNATDSLALAN